MATSTASAACWICLASGCLRDVGGLLVLPRGKQDKLLGRAWRRRSHWAFLPLVADVSSNSSGVSGALSSFSSAFSVVMPGGLVEAGRPHDAALAAHEENRGVWRQAEPPCVHRVGGAVLA